MKCEECGADVEQGVDVQENMPELLIDLKKAHDEKDDVQFEVVLSRIYAELEIQR